MWWWLSRALYAGLCLFHSSFCCGRGFDEVLADECHERETVEESIVGRRDECCAGLAEQGLVHVF